MPPTYLSTTAGPAELPSVGADNTTGVPVTAACEPLPAIPGYEIRGLLGKGGMGAVLLGRDPDLGRDVAVKVLLEAHHDRPELIRRFLEEAQISGQLQHPGIVPVYELGRFADDRPFFTMKLVKGQTLADLLGQRATPQQDLPRFLTIFEQICRPWRARTRMG